MTKEEFGEVFWAIVGLIELYGYVLLLIYFIVPIMLHFVRQTKFKINIREIATSIKEFKMHPIFKVAILLVFITLIKSALKD